MKQYKIEQSVPMPQAVGRGTIAWISLCKKMNVGDSVLLDNMKEGNSMRTAVINRGMKVSIREQVDGKARAWRIK